jgi:hypothetical protein
MTSAENARLIVELERWKTQARNDVEARQRAEVSAAEKRIIGDSMVE